jgi:peptidoglycan/xylan/chitin deacetylase (PgdA/CDA1 family)
VLAGAFGFEYHEGAVVRGPTDSRQVALEFTGHEFGEGGDVILEQLRRHQARASFFFTGDFLRNPGFRKLVQRVIEAGHYLGPHSDKHLLYCSWETAKRTLVTRDEFRRDLENNLKELLKYGVSRASVRYWVPAYEWYNPQIVRWSAEAGLQLINFTPGTRSNADYTGEADKNFVSSKLILASILEKERKDPHGLNGFLLLLHVGAGPARKDKMYERLGELLDVLSTRGYQFVRVDELLASYRAAAASASSKIADAVPSIVGSLLE